MKVTQIDVTVHRREPSPNPIRDALESLPGAGSVTVAVHTDDGIVGAGDAYFGRIAGAPDALAALIEHELKPLVLGTDPADVRGEARGDAARDGVSWLRGADDVRHRGAGHGAVGLPGQVAGRALPEAVGCGA